MLSSTSVQKFNNKKPKKKCQHLEENKEVKNPTSVRETELRNLKPGIKYEEKEKNTTGFIDAKDFPELRVPEKLKVKCSSEGRSKFSNTKPWLSVITSESKKKIIPTLPSLSMTEIDKNNENSSNIPKEVQAGVVSENYSSGSTASIFEKKWQPNTYIKENKPTSQKTATQPYRNPNKKKRSDPVCINFQDILTINKVLKKGRQHSTLRSKVQRRKQKELLFGNFLDSSNPKRNRGKHREIKKKKLTNFKMKIIKERILKSKMRENTISNLSECKSLNLLNKTDFNSEIKIYLNELNNKKLLYLDNKKNKKQNENLNKSERIKVGEGNIQNVESKSIDIKEEKCQNLVVQEKKTIPQITPEGDIRFSSKFREYCDNIITSDLNTSVIKLISELIKLQDRLFLRDPIKAKAKKRHVSGIREVKKYLNLKKVKMIIIAPNLEKLQMEGSVYDTINELKSLANDQNVPYGFALDRYKLGRCTRKNVPVSAFAVLSYDGLEDLFKEALQQLLESKKNFLKLTQSKVEKNSEDINSKVLSNLVTAFKKELKVSDDGSPPED